MGSAIGRIIVIVGATLLVVLGGLLIAPQLVPASVYRERIQAAAQEALGREVLVPGDIRISVFPRIEARAGGATIANPEGFGDAPFASMKELRAAVKLWPLLFRRVEIDEFVLVEPNIALIQLADGSNNWTFEFAQTEPKPDEPPGSVMQASLGDVRIVDGRVSYEDRATGETHALADLDLKVEMQAMDKPLQVAASGVADDLPFKLGARVANPQDMLNGAATEVTIDLATDLITTDLDGSLALGDKPAFDFAFKGEVPSVPRLADAFKLADLPARAALGSITASGRALGTPDDITLKVTDARHESDLLNADFKGDVRIAQFVTLDIDANAEAPRLADLAAAMAIDAPAAEALGKATATTKIAGQLGDLAFTDVKFRHASGLLDIAFDGSARLAADLTHAGRLSISAPDLRRLAAAAGTTLPPGDAIYKAFSLTGDTSGGTRSVLMKNAVVQFDAIRGTGEAALSFGGRPKLVGSLATNAIDVTPYATASGAPKEKKTGGGWGAEPLDLTPLRLADADLTLKSEGVRFQKFDFGPSNVLVNLAGGKLTADLRQTSLFGGAGGALIVADGSGAIPAVAIKAKLDGLSLKPFLGAAAGFDLMEGKGGLNVDITGSGGSLQALMESLAGAGAFAFDEGVIRGVNLNELVKTAQTSLKNKSIPLSAFGAGQSTTFNDLKASFSMKDGVAAMADLKVENSLMTVSGGGSLDIGGQKLSLSLFPEFKDRNAGVKGYGLPVKLSGDWTGVNLAFDFDWLVQRAVADVRAKVTTEIEDELKKQLGGDFANIFGAGRPAAPPAPATPPAAAPTGESPTEAPPAPAPAPKPSVEDRAKQELNKALGGILRPN